MQSIEEWGFNAFEKQVQGRLGSNAEVRSRYDIALVCIVVRGLIDTPASITRMFQALESAGINCLSINRSSEGISLVIAVDEEDYIPCINAIYREFA